MNTIKEQLEALYPDCKVIYLTLSGSRLHGTSTPKSDTDYKGIFIPSIESIIRGKALDDIKMSTGNEFSKNTHEDIDYELVSLNKFYYLLSTSDSGAVSLLFSMFSTGNTIIYESKESLFFKENYHRMITNNTQAFTGFALKQVSKYSLKGERVLFLDKLIEELNYISENVTKSELKKKMLDLTFKDKNLIDYLLETIQSPYIYSNVIENKEYLNILNRNFEYTMTLGYFIVKIKDLRGTYGSRAAIVAQDGGVDFKAFAHAVRVITECITLMKTGFIQYPLENSEFLLKIKNGEFKDIGYLSQLVEDLISELDLSAGDSKSPKDIDKTIKLETINFMYNLKENECSTFVLEK